MDIFGAFENYEVSSSPPQSVFPVSALPLVWGRNCPEVALRMERLRCANHPVTGMRFQSNAQLVYHTLRPSQLLGAH